MFRPIVTAALFAGFLAGLAGAALQLVFVQPVLLHAELYEGGQLVHFGAAAVSAHQDLPLFEPVRDGLSVLFAAVVYCGYALLLVAAMALAQERGAAVTARSGILWGLAGFITFHLAPGFGLPPELPGVAAADLAARQVWWVVTVLATGIGLWLVAFGTSWAAWGVAIVLIAAPHIAGAPHPDAFTGPVPPELGSLFAARALGVGMAVWVVLGMLAAHFWQSEIAREAAPSAA